MDRGHKSFLKEPDYDVSLLWVLQEGIKMELVNRVVDRVRLVCCSKSFIWYCLVTFLCGVVGGGLGWGLCGGMVVLWWWKRKDKMVVLEPDYRVAKSIHYVLLGVLLVLMPWYMWVFLVVLLVSAFAIVVFSGRLNVWKSA